MYDNKLNITDPNLWFVLIACHYRFILLHIHKRLIRLEFVSELVSHKSDLFDYLNIVE